MDNNHDIMKSRWVAREKRLRVIWTALDFTTYQSTADLCRRLCKCSQGTPYALLRNDLFHLHGEGLVDCRRIRKSSNGGTALLMWKRKATFND